MEQISKWLEEVLSGGQELVLGIDGDCGSGKSTIAAMLQERFDARLLHLDDYFLPSDQRGTIRQETSMPNVDHLRFRSEVLEPLKQHKTIHYRRYDCHAECYLPEQQLPHQRLTIIEGSYCMHPFFRPYLTHALFVTCSSQQQQKRIYERNPELYEDFIKRWIPNEHAYFDQFSIQEHCDLVVDTTQGIHLTSIT